MFFVRVFDLYKEDNNCMISFLSFSELFPTFNWAKEIGNLLRIWLGVSIFSPCPDCCLLNSRIFSTIFTFSFGLSVYFSSLLISSVSFLKSLNPPLIKFTWISFFSALFFYFFYFSSNAPRSWTRNCLLTNTLSMSLTFILSILSRFL